MDHYQVIKRPLITEKGMRCNEEQNTVVFRVDPRANKVQVKKAVEALFRVQVLHVNTLNMRGKRNVCASARGKNPIGRRLM